MGLTFNGKTPSAIQIGGKQVDNIVMNGEVVWPEGDTTDYFYVQNQYNGSNTITVSKNGSPSTGADIQASLDKVTWYTISDYGSTCTISLSVLNKKVYFRSSTGFSEDYSGYYTINGSRNFSIGGKLGTIIDYTNNNLNTIPAYSFVLLFSGCTTLINAENLSFTGLNIARDYACSAMFNECSNLTVTPNLRFTSVGQNACASMFRRCTSLTTASSVTIASTVGMLGCSDMFYGCTALTAVPTLSATSLADQCYYEMFQGCTSLTTSPELRAATLASGCYYYMFKGCTNLNKIIVRATSWNTSYTYDWVDGVSLTGDFYNLGGATIPRGTSGIPQGWTRVDY